MKKAITFFLLIGMIGLTGCFGAKKDVSIIDQIDVTQIEKTSATETPDDKTSVDEKPDEKTPDDQTSVEEKTSDDNVEYTWNDGGEKVTAEWLKEEFDLSDDDLDGIDVEKVAWALWWDQESVLEEFKDNKDYLLTTMRAAQKQLDTPVRDDIDSTYSNILDLENKTGMPDFDSLTRVDFNAFYQDEGVVSMISGLLDVKEKKIYYFDGGNVADVIGTDSKAAENIEEYDLTDEEIDCIISVIEEGSLDSYLPYAETDGWRVAFEFEDGSTYSYPLYNVYNGGDQWYMVSVFFHKMEDEYAKRWFKLPELE